MSRYILDTRLSESHYVVCTEAIRRGVITPSDLNEGRRTIAEQWHFYRNQPPLAAFPSPNAPHIKTGRENHDIDVNSFNGAARRLANFYESQGINVSFCVGGENWHICVHSETELKRAAARIRRQRDLLISRVGETEPRISFFKHQLHYLKDRDTRKPYFATRRPEGGFSDKFTPELEASVRAFQRDHGLRGDGVIGPVTDRKIDVVYSRTKRRRRAARIRARERREAVLRGEQL